MSLIVQKYGGSSVANADKLRQVAERVVATRRQGHAVVVVVSAMGKTTNELLGLANDLAETPARRELDMLLSAGERISSALLAMTIQELGEAAISLSGPQAGIRTTDEHFNAKIRGVFPERLRQELAAERIVVVAGYQGANHKGEVTTLGRGGSDTSAVALAAALNADCCEICSDVDGVYSADPRVVEDAQPLERITYQDMLALARHGAQVLNPRAVTAGLQHQLPIRARASFSEEKGTLVCGAAEDDDTSITGIAGHRAVLWVTVRETATHAAVRNALRNHDIFLEQEKQNAHHLLLSTKNMVDPEALAERLRADFGAAVDIVHGLGSVSAVGLTDGKQKELLAQATRLLEEAGIQVPAGFQDDHSLSCLVPAEQVAEAQQGLHRMFLGKRLLDAKAVA